MTHTILYDFPRAAYLVFVSFAILWLLWHLFDYRRTILNKFAQREVLQKVLIERSPTMFWSKVAAIWAIWILATFALMQPKSQGKYPEEYFFREKKEVKGVLRRKAHDVVLLVDASASMRVADARGDRTRLDYAKEIGDAIIGSLQGESVGLYGFTSEPVQLSPQTYDYLFPRVMLRSIRINEGGNTGTDLRNVIDKLFNEHLQGSADKLSTWIFLTDGDDTSSSRNLDEGRLSVPNLRVVTIGIGTEEGGKVPGVTYQGKQATSKLNESLLQQLSQKGRGRYYRANDLSALTIAEDIRAMWQLDDPYTNEETVVRKVLASSGRDMLIHDLYYQIPLGIAIVLFLFVLLCPDTRCFWAGLALLVVFGGQELHAQSSLEGEMREATTFLEASEYERATEKYKQLLKGDLDPWQHAYVMYYLGVLRFVEEDWSGAALKWSRLDQEVSSPFLNRAVQTALAWAYVHQAHASEDLQDRVYYYKEALHTIKKAQDANCKLTGCESANELVSMRRLVKQRVSESLQEQGVIVVKSEVEGDPKSPQEALQGTIDRQKEALRVNRLSERKDVEAQLHVIRSAEKFIPLVLVQQRETYETKCQNIPWNQVIPLFDQGYQQAIQAFKQGSIMHQEKALESWKRALAFLEEPHRSSPTEIEDVEAIRVLQEMEEADRLPIKETIIPKKGERPW